MKKRILALLLLLIFALAACTSDSGFTKEGKDPNSARPTRGAAARQGSEDDGVDIGAIDGNTYRHVTLGVCASFPGDWTLRDGALIADGQDSLDRAATADAVEAGQEVTVFSAADPTLRSRVTLSVSKNPLPGEDADALVNYFAPLVRTSYHESASAEPAACDPVDVDFCEEDHVVLAITHEKVGLATVYEKIMYLPEGELLYTLIVSTESEDTTAALLSLFETIR
ncbi:MAG: hypothetical protein IJJ99_10260 [Oscillospiraceae bacterium]|nr:hypothetical protein [Oscillospiraceae bacterium]